MTIGIPAAPRANSFVNLVWAEVVTVRSILSKRSPCICPAMGVIHIARWVASRIRMSMLPQVGERLYGAHQSLQSLAPLVADLADTSTNSIAVVSFPGGPTKMPVGSRDECFCEGRTHTIRRDFRHEILRIEAPRVQTV